jgi:hypothetical protein
LRHIFISFNFDAAKVQIIPQNIRNRMGKFISLNRIPPQAAMAPTSPFAGEIHFLGEKFAC